MSVSLHISPHEVTVGDYCNIDLTQDIGAVAAFWYDPIDDVLLEPVDGWNGDTDYNQDMQMNDVGNFSFTVLFYGDNWEYLDGTETREVLVDDLPPDGPPAPPPATGGGGSGGNGGGSNPPPAGNPPPTTGIPGVDAVLQYISERINAVVSVVQDIANRLGGAIAQRLEDLIPTTLQVLAGTNHALSEFVGAFNNNLVKVPDYWAALTGQLRSAYEATDQPTIAFIRDSLVPHLDNIVEGEVLAGLGAGILVCLDTLRGEPEWDAAAGLIGDIASAAGPIAAIPIGLASAAVLLDILKALASANIARTEQVSFRQFRPTLVSAERALDLERQGLLSERDATENMARSGLPDVLIDALREGTKPRLTPGELLSLANRGNLTDGDLDGALTQLGYQDQERTLLTALRAYLPTPSDVISWLQRDVFIPEFVERFGLDLEFPRDSLEGFTHQGIDEATALNFWRAHWELPSISQGFEMFQRQAKASDGQIVDEVSLRRLLRAKGVEPYWRDAVIAISYNPLTRVDIRRMHKTGVLSDDELVRAYQNIGYSPDDAARLRDFTIRLNTQEVNHNKLDVTAGMRTHILGAYQNGVLTKDDASAQLTTLGFDADHITAFLTEADYTITASRLSKVRASVKRLFVAGDWTEEHARASLADWGATAGEIDFLLSDWQIDREFKTLSDEQKHQRDLTKGEILEAYRDGIIEENHAHDMLAALGYDEEEILTLLSLTQFRAIKAARAEQLSTIHDAYVSRVIDRPEASNTLDALQVSSMRRDALLIKWTAERAGKQARLSLATIEEMVRREIITDDEVIIELGLQHYTNQQIARLLRLWGSREQERKDKAAADIAAHVRHLSTQDVVREYQANVLTKDQAHADLLELKYSPDDADVLLTLSPRQLSAQQIAAALKSGAVSRQLAHDRLIQLTYTEADAKILLDTAEGVHHAQR